MPTLSVTKLDGNHRTTVPREVRRLLELKPGDRVEWLFEGGKVVVRKASG